MKIQKREDKKLIMYFYWSSLHTCTVIVLQGWNGHGCRSLLALNLNYKVSTL